MNSTFADIVSVEPKTFNKVNHSNANSSFISTEGWMLIAGVVVVGVTVWGIVESQNPNRVPPESIMQEDPEKTVSEATKEAMQQLEENPVLSQIGKNLARQHFPKNDKKVIEMEVSHGDNGPVLVQSGKDKGKRILNDLSQLPDDVAVAV